jgi:hypothetical protein
LEISHFSLKNRSAKAASTVCCGLDCKLKDTPMQC